ncbi:MAG: DUF4301 family protein [Bacteroidales bacterium]
MNLTEKDLKQMQSKGISREKIERQLHYLNNGFPYLDVKRPATIKDGIVKLSDPEIEKLISLYKKSVGGLKIIKFVPASGAATRMFKFLYDFDAAKDKEEALKIEGFNTPSHFFNNLEKFAFIEDLKKFVKISSNPSTAEKIEIFKKLIGESGLNYGFLPKGLLKFHKYSGQSRTPVEEHLVEGALYASTNQKVNIHLTVSKEHWELFEKQINKAIPELEAKYKVKFEVSLSVQASSTDSVAVILDCNFFKDKEDNLFYRPGGHGALIENLNQLDGDVIFIKNIDNVVPDRLKEETVKYKMALAGLLLQTQQNVFNYLKKLNPNGNITNKLLIKVEEFLRQVLFVELPEEYANYNNQDKLKYLRSKLNRPLRVCGMVKNEGEPGGGPFWALNNDKSVSLQIVESNQIDPKSTEKQAIVSKSTHFNPVDLVCAPKNSEGEKFNLPDYVDHDTGFISIKSKDGVDIKAVELPGLWNGAMSNWNTIFVEVPLITFNPVKTVNDLLRSEHQ